MPPSPGMTAPVVRCFVGGQEHRHSRCFPGPTHAADRDACVSLLTDHIPWRPCHRVITLNCHWRVNYSNPSMSTLSEHCEVRFQTPTIARIRAMQPWRSCRQPRLRDMKPATLLTCVMLPDLCDRMTGCTCLLICMAPFKLTSSMLSQTRLSMLVVSPSTAPIPTSLCRTSMRPNLY